MTTQDTRRALDDLKRIWNGEERVVLRSPLDDGLYRCDIPGCRQMSYVTVCAPWRKQSLCLGHYIEVQKDN
jgi:hypothetical protein